METTSLKAIERIAGQVGGFLGRREGRYLYWLAKLGSTMGAVVEIGSWEGKSTIWLAKGSEAANGGKVYAIDPHWNSPEQVFRRNMKVAGVDARVVSVAKTSMEAVKEWSRPIGFLWIDGNHSYESVRSDFMGFAPSVVSGGIIALHDTYSFEGVRKFVEEAVLSSDGFQVLGQFDSILAVRKVERLSVRDRAKRRIVIILRRVFNRGRAERRHWRALPRRLLRALSIPRV